MYAVIQTGGKQLKVSPGDVVRVDSFEAKPGDKIEIKDVYMVADGDKVNVGNPTIAKAKVTAEVLHQGRGDKVAIFKHKGRKNHRKGVGHRQNFTALRIKDIKA